MTGPPFSHKTLTPSPGPPFAHNQLTPSPGSIFYLYTMVCVVFVFDYTCVYTWVDNTYTISTSIATGPPSSDPAAKGIPPSRPPSRR